ncbi:MAG TPA: GAF and ANTAR domain-containing protein [Pseudonocardia sp.]|uniref:GAF and ANTAR domain-containing protein n=1 Tax=Pseudonocardia sp. TaxID=60912 RepID=UPI002B4AE83E|nr:GAF and ANTAR domain-containing protein [Pseudonocardia sp.]HLU57803.1 GAF and ANTAR domain-containing protein [Pseudonocardia sp.]
MGDRPDRRDPHRDDAAAELAAPLLSTESFDDLLRGVAELSADLVGGASTASLTLAEGGRVITVAAADPVATRIDVHQYERGAGPCLLALHTATVVHVPDLRAERRWADFDALVLSHGLRSVLAVPLLVRGGAVGVLNLYARGDVGFDERDLRLAEALAAHAAVALTAALRTYDHVSLTDHLRAALTSRSVIDQAIGIVMARERCSADEAFDVLRRVSQQRNTKLRDVAADLVSAVAKPPGGGRPVPPGN